MVQNHIRKRLLFVWFGLTLAMGLSITGLSATDCKKRVAIESSHELPFSELELESLLAAPELESEATVLLQAYLWLQRAPKSFFRHVSLGLLKYHYNRGSASFPDGGRRELLLQALKGQSMDVSEEVSQFLIDLLDDFVDAPELVREASGFSETVKERAHIWVSNYVEQKFSRERVILASLANEFENNNRLFQRPRWMVKMDRDKILKTFGAREYEATLIAGVDSSISYYLSTWQKAYLSPTENLLSVLLEQYVQFPDRFSRSSQSKRQFLFECFEHVLLPPILFRNELELKQELLAQIVRRLKRQFDKLPRKDPSTTADNRSNLAEVLRPTNGPKQYPNHRRPRSSPPEIGSEVLPVSEVVMQQPATESMHLSANQRQQIGRFLERHTHSRILKQEDVGPLLESLLGSPQINGALLKYDCSVCDRGYLTLRYRRRELTPAYTRDLLKVLRILATLDREVR